MESREDHQKWLELRDTHAAALIRHEVIEKGRRALVVYGIMHLQRRNLFSNYELVEDPNVHTLVQQLEREGDARVFTVWPTAGVDLPELQPDVASWRAPSLVLVRGTVLGAADFTAFYPAEVPRRVTIRDGRIVPIPREQWRSLSAEEQFDAVLYLGPPSGMTRSLLSPALCRDPAYMDMRRERLSLVEMQRKPGAAATVLRPRSALTTRTGRTPRRIRHRPSPRGLFYRRPPVRGRGAASAAADLAARPGRPRAGALRRRWSCAAVAGAPWQPRRPPPPSPSPSCVADSPPGAGAGGSGPAGGVERGRRLPGRGEPRRAGPREGWRRTPLLPINATVAGRSLLSRAPSAGERCCVPRPKDRCATLPCGAS